MWMRGRKEGVITAFFALVLLLVIAMFLCLAESARLSACNRIGQSILRFGTKSLLGSYDLSLYENYHIFGRSMGEEDKAKKELSQELSWYMQQNLSGNSWLSMRADKPEITEISTLTKENGAMFYAQAIQYEKYREVKEFADWIISAVQETKKAEKVGVLIQKSLEAGEGAAKAEATLTELLGCLDGFVVEDGALVRSLFGRIKTVENFSKKLVPHGAGEWILAGSSELYAAQKKNYIDPVRELEAIIETQKRIGSLEESISYMQKQYELLYWNSQNTEQENTKAGEEGEENNQREEIAERIRQLSESISAMESERSASQNILKTQLSDVREKIKGARDSSQKALELLSRLEIERDLAKEELTAYGAELSEFAGEVPDAIYQELTRQNNDILTNFSNKNSIGILKDIEGMRKALENNLILFDATLTCISNVEAHSFDGVQVISGITAAAANLLSLNLDELVLDYGKVTVPERNNPYPKLAKKFFKYGILSLVAAKEEELSKGRIPGKHLPSALYTKERESSKKFSFRKLLGADKEDAFSFSFGDTDGFLTKAAGEVTEEYLYLSYLKRHFAAFADENDLSASAEEVQGLLYQLEYIIAGEESDRDNLSEIATKIFLVRFAVNLAVIFASHESRAEIKTAAVTAVGFTGIGALILFAELLIGMIWAAECALTEVGGLFLSGEVPFFPTAKSLAVPFQELSRVSKDFWQQSAEKYTKSKAGGILKNYREYLYLFLILEDRELRTMRTMDVIQQAMQLKYDKDFLMQNCIYSLETKAEITIPYLFLPVIGIRAGEGGRQEKKAGISY